MRVAHNTARDGRSIALERRDAIVRSPPIAATPTAIHTCDTVRYHDAALCCPACGESALHRDGLRIRDCDSIAILIFCESCGETSELRVESDKGRIFLAWQQP